MGCLCAFSACCAPLGSYGHKGANWRGEVYSRTGVVGLWGKGGLAKDGTSLGYTGTDYCYLAVTPEQIIITLQLHQNRLLLPLALPWATQEQIIVTLQLHQNRLLLPCSYTRTDYRYLAVTPEQIIITLQLHQNRLSLPCSYTRTDNRYLAVVNVLFVLLLVCVIINYNHFLSQFSSLYIIYGLKKWLQHKCNQ